MTKKRPLKYIQDLFDLAGTSTKLAAALELHAYTVENWRRTGVPIRYWDKLHDLYGILPAELYVIRKSCRERVKNPSKS